MSGRHFSHLIASLILTTGCVGGLFDYLNDPPTKLEAVDLGLPSGTLWASQNIYATHNWDLGGSFAWGETQQKEDLANYSFLADETFILEPQDDAASVILGGNWRIPTKWEWDELFGNCSWEKIKSHKIIGYLFSSKVNSNRIFIPAYKQKGILGPVFGFDYWTSCASANKHAVCVDLASASWPEFGECERTHDLYIRPVLARRAPTEGIAFLSPYYSLTAGATEKVAVDFTPTDALDKRIDWSSSDADIVYIDNNGNVTALYPGTAYLSASTPSGLSTKAEVIVSDYIVPMKVNLGLPSGILWADRNLGAVQEDDRGLMFAWGEVRPRMFYTQQNYKGPSISSSDYVLAPEYDAATVLLGEGWKMPTESDYNELIENCDIQFDYIKWCYVLTSRKNGAVLHLRTDFYWTATQQNHRAVYFDIALTDKGIQPRLETIYDCYKGLEVRPIYTSKAIE